MGHTCSFLVLLAILILQSLFGRSQGTNLQKPIEYSLKSDIFLFNGKAPFWITTNQYSTVPNAKNFAFSTRASLKADYQRDSSNKFRHFIGWGAHILPVLNIGDTTALLLPEGFLKLRMGSFEIWAGRRREVYGLLGDTLLSAGSFAWSGNAFPMPKIQLNTTGFVDVPGTRSLLAFNASFSHGLLGNMPVVYGGRGIKSIVGYLHQKTFYLKIGKPHWRLHFWGGFNHQAQWGGENQIWPHGLPPQEAWWAVVSGKPWEGSRVGNHIGTIDVGFQWKLNTGTLFFYRQNIYDDGSLYTFLNIKDGLNGISFQNQRPQNNLSTFHLNKVVLEYMNSYDQGGDVFDFVTGVFGRDNYINHYVYKQGWSYQGQGIGTPFIASQEAIKKVYPRSDKQFTNNNRVKALHVAAMGNYGDWNWLLKTSYSLNFGIYDVPFSDTPRQFSGLIQIQKPLSWLKGLSWTTTFSIDRGSLFDSATGLQVGLCKSGNF
ncbi:MAG: capsule assembly Wzi family protein [Spirosomataceae bacterium]